MAHAYCPNTKSILFFFSFVFYFYTCPFSLFFPERKEKQKQKFVGHRLLTGCKFRVLKPKHTHTCKCTRHFNIQIIGSNL